MEILICIHHFTYYPNQNLDTASMEYWDFWSCWDHKGEQILHYSIVHHHKLQLLNFFFPTYWPFSIPLIWIAYLRFSHFFEPKYLFTFLHAFLCNMKYDRTTMPTQWLMFLLWLLSGLLPRKLSDISWRHSTWVTDNIMWIASS